MDVQKCQCRQGTRRQDGGGGSDHLGSGHGVGGQPSLGRGVGRVGWELTQVNPCRWRDTQEASCSNSSLSGKWRVKGPARSEGQGWVGRTDGAGGVSRVKGSAWQHRRPRNRRGPCSAAQAGVEQGAEPCEMRAAELDPNLDGMRGKRRAHSGLGGVRGAGEQRQQAGRTRGRGCPPHLRHACHTPATPQTPPPEPHSRGDRTPGVALGGDWRVGHQRAEHRKISLHRAVAYRHVRSVPD